MSFPVVVDATVVTKWLLPEAQSEIALGLLKDLAAQDARLLSPDLLWTEVANALNRQAYVRNLLPEEVEQAWNAFVGLQLEPVRSPKVLPLAMDLASRLNRSSVYDCCYLAVSEIEGCPYWTANRRFFISAQVRFPQVRWLGDYEP